MSNSANTLVHGNDSLGFHGENDSATASGAGVPPLNPGVVPVPNPVDIGSHISLNVDLGTDFGGSIRG